MDNRDTRSATALSQIAANLGLNKWNFDTTSFNSSVENYFGEIVMVYLTGVKDSGEETSLQLICKLAPLHLLQQFDFVSTLYSRESYSYSVLFEDYKALNTRNVSIRQLVPECYFSNDSKNEQIIVLKNMLQEGYHRYNGEMFMDVGHAEVALKTLAQFHVLSLIIQEKDPQTSEKRKAVLKPYGEMINPTHIEFLKKGMNNILETFKGTKYENSINEINNTYEEAFQNEVKYSNIAVFGHGDFWKENILFKYKNNKPDQACLLDFQMVRLTNPAFDVLCFILNCLTSETRRLHYQELLCSYYNTLQKTLTANGVNGQKLYTRLQFDEDLKSIYPVCFAFVQSAFFLWLGLDSSVVASKNQCQNEKQTKESMQKLKLIISDILDDLHFFGYFEI